MQRTLLQIMWLDDFETQEKINVVELNIVL